MTETDKIEQVSNLTKNPELYKEILTELRDCINFDYFLTKVEREIKNNNFTSASELKCAYLLKKQCGFTIGFLPEHIKQGWLIPAYKKTFHYDNMRKPDFCVMRGKEKFYVEVKTIKINVIDILKSTFMQNYDFKKATQTTSDKIKNSFESAIEQIENFGAGYVYIECQRGHVDVDTIREKIEHIFREHDQIIGLILVYGGLKINDMTRPPLIKIFKNPHFKKSF
jgi:hypothetical protein